MRTENICVTIEGPLGETSQCQIYGDAPYAKRDWARLAMVLKALVQDSDPVFARDVEEAMDMIGSRAAAREKEENGTREVD